MRAEIIYYVNEEKGTVVAKCPEAAAELFTYFERMINKIMSVWDKDDLSFGKNEFVRVAYNWIKKNCHVMDNLVGKAKCNYDEGEVFDVEVGKKLARDRLLLKLEDYRVNFFSYMFSLAFEIERAIFEELDFHALRYEKLNKDF